ncbi:alpha/beta hydrolase-fold protein [Pedobacter sp. P351]|uniref:esterase family protein n=1 Tax=Pedobacter superstes TaxID=3133441 RepID=UPI00309B972C
MNREYHKWYSPALEKDMELLVFGHSGATVLFFPPRTGRFYEYEDWHLIETLEHKIEQGFLQVYCVDSIDAESFYNEYTFPDQKMARHLQYERYILNEVLPLIHYKNPWSFMIAAGCSLGAYHAVNFSFKYPQYFNKVVAMSGRYDLTKKLSYYNDLLEGYWDETIYFNMPSQYINNISEHDLLALSRLEIVLAVGNDDPFYENNKSLSEELSAKGINNRLFVWNGVAHNAKSWRKMLDIYL